MKTLEQIRSEVSDIIQRNYYSEDFELISSFQIFIGALSSEEKNLLADVVFERLLAEGSIVDIMLCGLVDVPSAAPVLAEKLSRESDTNQVTRSIISALQHYPGDDGYVAVERFLDSDQELEALSALARIDFVRTLPAIVRRMSKEYMHGNLLHLLHERSKTIGIDALIIELTMSSATKSTGFRENLPKVLASKAKGYNPFNEEELATIKRAFV
jgi:hypothetical protein